MTIATVAGSVRVHWTVREELLARFRARADGAAVVQAFEVVGTSRPVELADTGRDLLREVVEEWVAEVGEFGPPAAVAGLREALAERAQAGTTQASSDLTEPFLRLYPAARASECAS